MADPRPPAEGRPSFRDAIARPKITINEATEFKNGGTFKGEPALLFSQEEYSSLATPFDMVLVGKFRELRPNMEFLRKGIQMIGFKGDVDLGPLDSHHVLIRFVLHEDYYRFWMRGSWSFKKHIMRVLKWTPEFTCEAEPPVAPVWISFNHLPLHLFQKGPLMSLASLVGRPLRIDAATRSISRPSAARICVEVNLLRNLPKRVWIGHGEAGFWQSVSYESLPLYCTVCSQLGHENGRCDDAPTFSKPFVPTKPPSQEWKLKEAGKSDPSGSGLPLAAKSSIPTDVPSTDSRKSDAPAANMESPSADAIRPVEDLTVQATESNLAPSANLETLAPALVTKPILPILEAAPASPHDKETKSVATVDLLAAVTHATVVTLEPAVDEEIDLPSDTPAGGKASPTSSLQTRSNVKQPRDEEMKGEHATLPSSVPLLKSNKVAPVGKKPLLHMSRAEALLDLQCGSHQLNKIFKAKGLSRAPMMSLDRQVVHIEESDLTETQVEADDSVDLETIEEVTVDEDDFIPVQKKKRGRPRKTIKNPS